MGRLDALINLCGCRCALSEHLSILKSLQLRWGTFAITFCVVGKSPLRGLSCDLTGGGNPIRRAFGCVGLFCVGCHARIKFLSKQGQARQVGDLIKEWFVLTDILLVHGTVAVALNLTFS